MFSTSVAFEFRFPTTFSFPERRQLQLDDPTSAEFQAMLRTAVATSFTPPIPEEHVLITTVVGSPSVLRVEIIGFDGLSVTPEAVASTAASSDFLAAIETAVGSTVTMPTAPTVTSRVTEVPSPPPSVPPTPPSPPPPSPPVTPDQAVVVSGNLDASSSNLDDDDGEGSLSREMIWVIIVTVILLLIVIGCVGAYCAGKRQGKTQTVQVGRPALRRQISPEELEQQRREAAAASVAPPDSPQGDVAVAEARTLAADQIRMVEIGMAVERSIQRQLSGDGSGRSQGAGSSAMHAEEPALASPKRGVLDAEAVMLQLDAMQAAIDDVRESLSPKGDGPGGFAIQRRASMSRTSSRSRSNSPRTPSNAERIRMTPALDI